ncbi:MAG: lysophospholipid acyltransferase family protein [Bdellovibrionaceae bacterium]|nr:lysophospholipid acyltransferase family protein [Pseudobdellovibrionaceae bacterium]
MSFMHVWIGRFFKCLSFLIASLPAQVRAALGDFIGLLWFDVLRIRRRVALENLRRAFPDWSEAHRESTARWSLRHMGRNLVEYTLFPFYDETDVARCFEIHGREHVENALALGKGCLFLGMHLGNGDFAIATCSRIGLSMNLISKLFKARWLNDLWFGMRRKHGTRFIAPEKSTFEILKALKRNEIVIFVLDQFMGPPVGVRTRFFGHETGTALGLALIAERTGAPVIPSYTFRKPDGRHVLVFEAPLPGLSAPDESLRKENIARMTQAYTDKIESIVRKHPEQWMWIHRRWKEFRD